MLMGYRCAPGVTILYTFFWTHFYTYVFNVKSGTINSAINSNLYAFDRECISTPFHSAIILKLGFVSVTNELLILFAY